MRDGSFSHFTIIEKWEKEPSLIPTFRFTKDGKKSGPYFHSPFMSAPHPVLTNYTIII